MGSFRRGIRLFSPQEVFFESRPSCLAKKLRQYCFQQNCLILATGRQPVTFSEISYGKSYIKIWILKEGVQGEPPSPAPVPTPFKIQIYT